VSLAPRTPTPPIEPPPTRAKFPDPRRARGREVLAVGSDFSPGTLLAAYRAGIFPWPHSEGLVPWCSPDPRAIFPLEAEPHWSRSLRRTLRKHPFEVTTDRAFRDVMNACGDTRPEGTWIIPEMVDAYEELHRLGWGHSVEVWDGGQLVGGIYGLAIGGLFAGESMFHTKTDASKIAFASLVHHLRARGYVLFDVQVMNDHLASLGCVEIPRAEYLDRVERAVRAEVTFDGR
jgi:leucyl/phenylalanyl-tRNA---protein transferase